jgi:hypothetical protein
MTLIWPAADLTADDQAAAFKARPSVSSRPSFSLLRGRCVCILPVSSQKAVCTPYSSPLFYFND